MIGNVFHDHLLGTCLTTKCQNPRFGIQSGCAQILIAHMSNLIGKKTRLYVVYCLIMILNNYKIWICGLQKNELWIWNHSRMKKIDRVLIMPFHGYQVIEWGMENNILLIKICMFSSILTTITIFPPLPHNCSHICWWVVMTLKKIKWKFANLCAC
jgi:hypothetical protein